jgi:hypothetical protein
MAYKRLLRGTSDTALGRTGKEVLEFLIEHDVLEAPTCFPDKAWCKETESMRVKWWEWWPVLGTGASDLVSSRQFDSAGQCFHFMARSQDVHATEFDATLGVPRGLAVDAYRRCMVDLRHLFDEMRRAPRGEREKGRGAYSLMHSVVDSYSAAHVERDDAQRIKYLKPWRVRAWLPYLVHWNGWQYFADGGKTHHETFDPRDDHWYEAAHQAAPDAPPEWEWERPERTDCGLIVAPYLMPEECLTARGKRSVAAVVDLLLLYYRSMQPGVNQERAHELWNDYVARHLASAVEQTVAAGVGVPEEERTSSVNVGARWRYHPDTRHHDASLVGEVLFPSVELAPFTPVLSLELGCTLTRGRCLVSGEVTGSVLVPVTNRLALGSSPLVLRGFQDSGVELDMGTQLGRLDVTWPGPLWLSASGPYWSWAEQRFRDEWFHLTLGWSFPESTPATEQRQADQAAREEWATPEVGLMETFGVDHALFTFGGASLVPDDDAHSYSAVGFELASSNDKFGRARWWGGGIGGDYRFRDHRRDRFYVLGFDWNFRLYPFSGPLSIVLSPLAVEVGYAYVLRSTGRKHKFAWDVGARPKLELLLFQHFGLVVDGPIWSYWDRARVVGTNVGLRAGLVID